MCTKIDEEPFLCPRLARGLDFCYLCNMYKYKEVKDNAFVLSIDNHEGVAAALMAFCKEKNILAGNITGLGAISEATFEITNLTGNISEKDGKPYLHLHITASRSDYSCIGGHLLEAYINGACELYVEAFPGVKIGRYQDPETGLNLYEF